MANATKTTAEKEAEKAAKKAEKEAAAPATSPAPVDEMPAAQQPQHTDAGEVKTNEDASRTVDEDAKPGKATLLIEMKGWKAWSNGKGAHVTDKEARIVGHFPDDTAAIRYVENVSRHVR